jgi:hypothetical protein
MPAARIHFQQVPLTVVKKTMKLQAKQKKTATVDPRIGDRAMTNNPTCQNPVPS